MADKKPKKTYGLTPLAKKELRKQELNNKKNTVKTPVVTLISTTDEPQAPGFLNQQKPNRYGFETEKSDNTNVNNVQTPITEDQNEKNMNPAVKSAKIVRDKRMVGMNDDGTPKTVTVETSTPKPKLSLEDYSSEFDKNGNIVLPEKRIDNSLQNRVKTATYNSLIGTGLENTGMGDAITGILTPIFTGLEQMQRGNKDQKFGREIIDNVLGLANIGIGLMPEMAGVNALSPFVTALTGDVAEGMGMKREEGEKVGHLLSLAPFGSKIMLAGLFSNSAGDFVHSLIKDKDINEVDKERIVETVSQVGFFTGLGAISGGKFLYKNIRNRLDLMGFDINKATPKEIDNAISQEIQLDNTRAIIKTLEQDKQKAQKQFNESQTAEERLKAVDVIEKVENKINEYKQKTEQSNLTEEPKPIETVTENKRVNEDDIYSPGNIKNPKYPDRTNKAVEENPKYLAEGKDMDIYEGVSDEKIKKIEDKYPDAILVENNRDGSYTLVGKNAEKESIKDFKDEKTFMNWGTQKYKQSGGSADYPQILEIENSKVTEVVPETNQAETPKISLPKAEFENAKEITEKLQPEKSKLEADLKVENTAKLPEPKQDAVEKVEGGSKLKKVGDKITYKGEEGEIIKVYPQDELDKKQGYQSYRIRTESGERDIDAKMLEQKTPISKNIKINTPLLNLKNTREKSYYEGVSYHNGEPVVEVSYIFNDGGKLKQDTKFIPYDKFEEKYHPLKNENEFKKVNRALRDAEKIETVKLGGLTETEKLKREQDKNILIEKTIGRKLIEPKTKQESVDKEAVSKEKEPYEMTNVEVTSAEAEKIFPVESKVEVVNGKPIYTHSTTVQFGGEKRTFSIESKSQGNISNNIAKLHKKIIQQALSEGKTVPEEVLKDYPELKTANPESKLAPEKPTEKEIERIYHFKPEIVKAKRLFGYFDNTSEAGKKGLKAVVKEFKLKIEIAKEQNKTLEGIETLSAKEKIAKNNEFIKTTQKGIDAVEEVKGKDIPVELGNLKAEANKLTYNEFKNEYEYLFDQKPDNYFKGSVKEFYDLASKEKPTLEQKKQARKKQIAEKKNKSDTLPKDNLPNEIADLYMRRSTLTFTENALRQQMGNKDLKGKAKIEYDNVVKELADVENKIAEYEQSKNPAIKETVTKNQEVSKLPPSLAERYEALKKEKEEYEHKLFKEKHTYYDSKTLEYEKRLDKLQERIDEVNRTKSIVEGDKVATEKKEAKGTEQGETKVKGENLLQQINKAIEDVKSVDVNKETPTAIASRLKELGYEIDAVKSGEFDESFDTMDVFQRKYHHNTTDKQSYAYTPQREFTRALSKVGIGEPRIVFKDANGTYKIPIVKLSEFKTKLEKAKIYNEAKQTIKSALSKDSGISFGGLSKLGDLADPKVLKAVYDVAKYHTGKFAEWSKKVIKDVGNWIKPHLRNLYNEITKDRTGLDNVVTQGINLNPIKKEVSETFEGAVDKIKRSADTIKKILAPVSRGENAKLTAKIITEKNAELARQEAIMTENFKEARKVFDKRSNAENLKMIDAIESGADINNPIEKSFANEVRKLLDAEYKKVTDRKGVKSFIENYFPHIWERDSQNQLQAMLSRRPFEGSKSFLKKRTIPTTREGIEAGLKPVTYNPVDLALLKLHEMKKFNMAHEIMDNLKAEGLVKYIPADYFAPAGWTKLNDKIGTIFGDPGITATEYVDKHLYNALQKLATDLNIKHSRVAELRGTRMGEASPAGYVNTKYATPEDVLAHEIGHHLQFKYNLWDYLTGDIHVEGRNKTDTLKKTRQERVKIHKELRALADLRAKGEKVSDSHKRYLREKDEKMAVVLQAYTHIPAEMREVAPTIFSKFEKFIDSKPELRQIKQIKPSLVPKGMDMKYDKNGILIKGHYYLPEPATRIINNHLSPGLKGEPIFDIYRGISNTLNQVQLGASLFHASFTSGDANLSKLALGLMKISRGKKEGFLDIATSPIAFITNPVEGNKIRKDYLSDRPNNPELVNAITRAGGRISMDRFYTNDLYNTVKKAFKDGKYISGSLKSPFAMFEVLSKPVLEYLVPRQKLGVFSGLAKDILQDEAKGKLTKDQATERLQEAWRSVDNRMGQLVYDNLYWDHVVKDIAMASVRSVGWNLGTFRELGGGIRDIPKIITEKRLTPRTAYALALPIGIGLLGAVYSYLNGTPAESIKDLYFPRTGHKNKDGVDDRISLPSYMKDVFAYGTDIKSALNTRDLGTGAKTLSHKMHPAISMLLDLINNHDYFGNEISDNTPFSPEWFVDEAKYIAKQFRPFTVNNISEMNKQGESLSKQLQSFFGFQLAPGYIRRSDMQNRIYDTYQKRNGEKIISKPEAETRELKRELKDLYLKDKNAYDEKIADLLEEGKISSRELNSIESDKPTDIKLFKYLPADDKIELWNQMNKEEKQRYQDGLTNKIRKTLNLPYKIPSNAPKGIIEKATPEQYTEYENEAEKRIMQFEKDNKGMDKDELQKQRNRIRKDIREEMNLETEKEKKKTHLYIPGQQNYFNQPKTFKNHLTIPK